MSDIFRPLLPEGVGKTYVEIGGVKWATMNIGANSVTDYGLYFQWGDTTGYTASQVGTGNYQKPFNWADCVLHNGTNNINNTDFTKYNGDNGLTELEPTNDAAVANWGGNWRMPTQDEMLTLYNAVNSQFVTDYQGSGVNGLLLTDKKNSSKKLFFPAGGVARNGNIVWTSNAYYWTGTIASSNVSQARWFGTHNGVFDFEILDRLYGLNIRPVLDE